MNAVQCLECSKRFADENLMFIHLACNHSDIYCKLRAENSLKILNGKFYYEEKCLERYFTGPVENQVEEMKNANSIEEDLPLDSSVNECESEFGDVELIRIEHANPSDSSYQSNKRDILLEHVKIDCFICSQPFKNVSEVIYHEKKHPMDRYYCPLACWEKKCRQFHEMFISLNRLKLHMKIEHNLELESKSSRELAWKCKKCKKFGLGFVHYYRHVKAEQNEERRRAYKHIIERRFETVQRNA